jgi:GNAT superfamily N-acetyltransferase
MTKNTVKQYIIKKLQDKLKAQNQGLPFSIDQSPLIFAPTQTKKFVTVWQIANDNEETPFQTPPEGWLGAMDDSQNLPDTPDHINCKIGFQSEQDLRAHYSPEELNRYLSMGFKPMETKAMTVWGASNPLIFEPHDKVKLDAMFPKPADDETLDKGQNGDWKSEGITFSHSPGSQLHLPNGTLDSQKHTIRATDAEGNHAGLFEFNHVTNEGSPSIGAHVYVNHATVSPMHRRLGIASEAYRQIEAHTGAKVLADPSNQSDDAKALWANKSGFGKSEDLDKGQNGDWQKEGFKLSYHPHKHDESYFEIHAHDKNGKKVGEAQFQHHENGKNIRSYDEGIPFEDAPVAVKVDQEHRRKGLGSAMYSHAEQVTGKKLKNIGKNKRTESGKALWSQPNRPFGKSEDLTKTPNEEPQPDLREHRLTPQKFHEKVVHTEDLGDGMYHHVLKQGTGTFRHLLSTTPEADHAYGHVAQIVGKKVQNRYSGEKFLQVLNSNVPQDYAGNGYGKQLYGLAAKHHGALISDRIVSPDARKVYESYNNHPDYNVSLGDIVTKNPSKYEVDAMGHERATYGSPHVLRYQPKPAGKSKLAAGEQELDAPDLEKAAEPNHNIRAQADAYAQSKGMTLNHDIGPTKVDPNHASKIAAAYGEMKHDPNHPDVKSAYGALINETKDQYNHIKGAGLKTSKIKPGQENPYSSGSKALFEDIKNNNHMWYYPTEQGFGNGSDQATDHPMLASSGIKDEEGKDMPNNDLFRIAHDYFGHSAHGHGFGPNGEEGAWKHHMQMYTPEAQKALTTETRGQNSTVNFGPNGEANRKDPKNTIFADQKAGLMPDWTHSTQAHKSEITDTNLNKAIQSPSKHVGWRRLSQIHQDNNIGESGKEYDEGEIKSSIVDRQVADADHQVKAAGRKPKISQGADVTTDAPPTIKKDENTLTHYSAHQGLKELHPEMMGSSGISGAQYKRGVPENKSTFYYSHGSAPEPQVLNHAKSKYTAKLDPSHKVYDMSSGDPEGHVKQVTEANQGAFNEDKLHSHLKSKGYHGVKWKMRPGTDVVQMYHPLAVHSEEPVEHAIGKSEDLEKMGAMRRIAPFNPASGYSPTTSVDDSMYHWQNGNHAPDRDILANVGMNPDATQRALHKLTGKTPTRRAVDGKREFLLHRGMSRNEINGSHIKTSDSNGKDSHFINHQSSSSWSPDLNIARSFQDKYNEDATEQGNPADAGIASAWVHEDHIGFVPNQMGSPNKPKTTAVPEKELAPRTKNEYHFENEIIVKPNHNSKLVHNNEVQSLLGHSKRPDDEETRMRGIPTNVDQAINQRAALKDPESITSNRASTSINRDIAESLRSQRAKKSEESEMSESSSESEYTHKWPFVKAELEKAEQFDPLDNEYLKPHFSHAYSRAQRLQSIEDADAFKKPDLIVHNILVKSGQDANYRALLNNESPEEQLKMALLNNGTMNYSPNSGFNIKKKRV